MDKFNKSWRTYKPNKAKKGAASQVQFNKKGIAFWVSANEIPSNDENAAFGWKDEANQVTIKLGENDIGELLAVIRGYKNIAGVESGKFQGIFHKNDRGSTSFMFQKRDDGNFNVRAAKKIGDTVTAVSHSISVGEAQILEAILSKIIQSQYDWD